MTSTSNHEDNSTRKATKSNLEAPPRLLFSVAPAETHMLPGHVERPERIQGVLSALTAAGFTVGGCYARMALQLPAKYLASTDQLTMTHFYVEEIAAKAAKADVEGAAIVVADEGDPDGVTYVCANSYRDALTAVGTLLQLVDAVVQYAPGEAKENAAELANAHPNPPAVAQDRNSPKLDDDDDQQQHARLETALPNPPVGFAIVRPPGHHATSATPLGFCLFNNVAVAARYAQRVHGLQRVMILDLDVHNGNGTAEIFWEDPTVLVVDVHESTDACYPSPPYVPSGIHAVGGGGGKRTTVNIPLPRNAGHDSAMMAYHEIIVPAARRFNPDIMLVSMGYDAHVNDPFELLQYRDITYHTLAASLKQLAAELCHGRLVFTLEGGYNPESLGKAVVATWLALIGQPLPTDVAAGDINVRPEPDLEQVEGMLLDLKRVLEL